MIRRLSRKAFFRIKQHTVARGLCAVRKLYWRVQGMHIGQEVRFSNLEVTWPHKVRLGDRCSLESGVYFNAAGPYTDGVSIEIGEGTFVGTGCEFNISNHLSVGANSLIAAGTRFVDHNHGTALGAFIKDQPETSGAITLGADVWVGANSMILQGVTIGEGAVVAAGSVVTRAVSPYTVVAGCPARAIRRRRPGSVTGPELVQTLASGAPGVREPVWAGVSNTG